jgi:hypothetical protein
MYVRYDTKCGRIPRILRDARVLEDIYPLVSLMSTPTPIQALAAYVAIGGRGGVLPRPDAFKDRA